MTLFWHELKRNKISLIIWTSVLSFMMLICVVIYPEMKAQMENLNQMLADMGEFTEAIGMDGYSIGDFVGYMAMECGEILGIGGALFAALCGISALAGEQKDGTAEFLLTHPVSRTRIAITKLLSVITRVVVMNAVVLGVSALATVMIGEHKDSGVLIFVWFVYLVMQLEVALITFGLSGIIKGGGIAIGLGVPFAFYFINLAANLLDELEFLKYFTPFGYAEGAALASGADFEVFYFLTGLVLTLAVVVPGFVHFNKKDI